MVRFSCFPNHIHRSKRAVQHIHDLSQTSGAVEKSASCEADLVLEDCVASSDKGMADQETDYTTANENLKCKNQLGDGCIGNYGHQEEHFGKHIKRWDEQDCEEFNIKRVEEWICQIDIQNVSPIQELGESSSSSSHPMTGFSGTVEVDAGGRSHGVEAAYKFISSSMSAASKSAQMGNLGLVAIPLLRALSSLRVLNLSGNAIVRIAAGVLPRGLHMLNLSKNNISTIEGLRELTRLRVLNLSYNRITRIGHGLASCSSLKELYLAGNKICEVEGLHRLLRLRVLDLRFNSISTAKCLGQLAANYGSLQAINLEGNPAQRNVGDEQLKQYLLSLIPHLLYFNMHAIIRKTNSSKDISDRPAPPGRFDRGVMRSEHKRPRRGNHSAAAASHKLASSSGHGT